MVCERDGEHAHVSATIRMHNCELSTLAPLVPGDCLCMPFCAHYVDLFIVVVHLAHSILVFLYLMNYDSIDYVV